MAQYKVAWNGTTKEARILASATAIPGGFIEAGTFTHDDDANDALHFHGNHAVYHHVRGILYRNANIREQNMQAVRISYETGVSIAPPT